MRRVVRFVGERVSGRSYGENAGKAGDVTGDGEACDGLDLTAGLFGAGRPWLAAKAVISTSRLWTWWPLTEKDSSSRWTVSWPYTAEFCLRVNWRSWRRSEASPQTTCSTKSVIFHTDKAGKAHGDLVGDRDGGRAGGLVPGLRDAGASFVAFAGVGLKEKRCRSP